MTPRARAIRRAWEACPYLSGGITAIAAREHRPIVLFAQWRGGRARFRTWRPGQQRPRGFSYFGDYCTGRGTWMLAGAFTTRAEDREWRRELRRRRAARAELAAKLRRQADVIEREAA